MNDFTKEELQLILKSIWWGGADEDTELLQNLDDKLQSMINNYCEHIPSDAHYEQFRWQICSKCGAQYK